MNGKNNVKKIGEGILEAIKKGRFNMRPKWHFVLKTILLIIGVIFIFFALLYLASFVIFVLRQTGVWFVPVFGGKSWFAFLRAIPWLLIFFAFVFVLILGTLIKRYPFIYKKPLFFSLGGILLLSLIGGFMVTKMRFHGRFFRFSENNNLPIAGNFYRNFGSPRLSDIHNGKITEIASSSFTIKTSSGEFFYIFLNPRTRLPFGADFSLGDKIVVFGPSENNLVRALGIREIDDDWDDLFLSLPPNRP